MLYAMEEQMGLSILQPRAAQEHILIFGQMVKQPKILSQKRRVIMR